MSDPGSIHATQTTLRVPPKVLLIGRGFDAAASLMQQMGQEGYLLMAEADPQRGLTLLRSARFELVLVEADLAEDGGRAAIQAVRQDDVLSALPVLAISASNDMPALERCLEAGADDYLPSMFGPAVLRARVNSAVDRERLQTGQHLRREMSVARTIQRDFLPQALPDVGGMELEAALRPALDVSGDFYDCFLLTSGEVMLVVGDVCDKGVGAALFMALFRSLIRASADPVGGGAIQMIGGRHTMVMQALQSASPAEMLTRVAGFTNDYIARLHGRTNMFATVFLASVEPWSGELVYVNAGHEPALVIADDGGIEELRPTGPALGMLPGSRFTAVTRTLPAGHSLFAFTDGLVEARSPAGEIYGAARLREVLRGQSSGPASEMVHAVLDDLTKFGRHAHPHDDVTILAARML